MNTSITRFHNLPDTALADALGAAACARKLAEQEEQQLTAELKRRGLERATGERFAVLRTRFTTWILDAERVREALGEPEYQQCCRVTARERIDVRDVRPAVEMQAA